MKILRANIHNFLTIADATMELSDRGLLLIVGDNADDTSANSNGAGKSSLVDAICWALYGQTARDVTGDDVINETAKKDCYVHLHIEDGGKLYNITRHRKHKINKNSLIVSSIDSSGVESDMSKGTDKETQEVVNALVGCSSEVFTSAVYAGQERMPDLPSMTDKSLKVLIEEAAGIQVLETAHSIAKKRLSEAKELANVELNKVNILENSINNITAHLNDTELKSKQFEDGKRGRAVAHLEKAKPYIEVANKAKTAEQEKANIEREIMDLSGELGGFKVQQERLNELQARRPSQSDAKSRLQAEYNTLAHRAKSALAEVKDSQALIGTPCKECGKAYCESDLHDVIDLRQKSIEADRVKLAEIKAQYSKENEALAKLDAEIEEVRKSLARKTVVDDAIRSLERNLNQIEHSINQAKVAGEAIARIKEEAKDLMTQDNPFNLQIKELNDKKAKHEAQKKAQQAVAEKAVAHVQICDEAVNVFGPAGVRAHILDTVTPFLNARTNDYLGALSDGNAHATWTTLSNTAKGEVKEKFSIAVSNDKGGSSFKKLSGGEKRKVRLATAMALQDLVASRATKPIQLFIADEIDYALDDSGLERLMTLLERKARERGTVLIISHQSGLRDWCDQVITVKKDAGYSRVSGDNMRTAVA